MTGTFFSSPTADEAILQIEFAKVLSDQPPHWWEKILLCAMAERAALSKDADDEALLDSLTGSGSRWHSIVPHEKDPAHRRRH